MKLQGGQVRRDSLVRLCASCPSGWETRHFSQPTDFLRCIRMSQNSSQGVGLLFHKISDCFVCAS